MVDASILNVGSLVLGIVACVLPVINLLQDKKHEFSHWTTLSFISFIACIFSLFFQMYYNYHLVTIGDWTAIEDTIGAVVLVSVGLIIVTILLNTLTFVSYRTKS